MSFVSAFRQSFATDFSKNILQWFPGHMTKGLRQMKQMLKDVDCVVEVHDSRIPLSGRNVLFQTDLLGIRPHLLVLNKCDLTDIKKKDDVIRALERDGRVSNVLYTDCRTATGTGVDKIVPTIIDMMKNTNRYNRSEVTSYNLLVIGVPNVGKSSLINALRNRHTRKKHATRVGAVAGITRSVLNKIVVCYDPPMFLLDTPGILEPKVNCKESALRLALCASMQDHLVGTTVIADYMLYWLNKHGHFSYVKKLGLEKPYDQIKPLLLEVAAKRGVLRKVRDPVKGGYLMIPDLDQTAASVIKSFRHGEFGKFLLDSDILQTS